MSSIRTKTGVPTGKLASETVGGRNRPPSSVQTFPGILIYLQTTAGTISLVWVLKRISNFSVAGKDGKWPLENRGSTNHFTNLLKTGLSLAEGRATFGPFLLLFFR